MAESATTGSASFVRLHSDPQFRWLFKNLFPKFGPPGQLESLSAPNSRKATITSGMDRDLSEMPTIRPSGRKQQSAKAH